MSDRTYKPTGDPGNSGDHFDLKCWKCGVWYNASCHWYTVFDKQIFIKRDKMGNRMFKKAVGGDDPEPIFDEAVFPRIKVENIEQHKCERGGAKYGV